MLSKEERHRLAVRVRLGEPHPEAIPQGEGRSCVGPSIIQGYVDTGAGVDWDMWTLDVLGTIVLRHPCGPRGPQPGTWEDGTTVYMYGRGSKSWSKDRDIIRHVLAYLERD